MRRIRLVPDGQRGVFDHGIPTHFEDIACAAETETGAGRCVVINIQNYGNTSAATVPIALDEAAREGRIEKGKLVVLVAFGAGLTWGGSLIRW